METGIKPRRSVIKRQKKEAAKQKAIKAAKGVGLFSGLSYLFTKLSKKL